MKLSQATPNKVFVEDVRKLMKGVSISAHRIWKQIEQSQDIQNIAFFCQTLFDSLTLSAKQKKIEEGHEAKFATLLVLEFYKNTRQKPEASKAVIENILGDGKKRFFEHARWVVDMFMNNSEEMLFAKNFISRICHSPAKFGWDIEPGHELEEFLDQTQMYVNQINTSTCENMHSCMKFIGFPPQFSQTKIITFAYCCFLDYVRSAQFQIKKQIYVHALDLLKALVHSLRTTTRTSSLLLSLLYLLQTMITYYGCSHEEVLKDMLFWVNIVRGLPGKNADIAYVLFGVIHSELKLQGTSFRKELKRSFPALDCKKAESLTSKRWLVTNRYDCFKSPEFCSLTTLRKLIILNALNCSKVENISKSWPLILNLDPESTFSLYFKVMKITDIASSLQSYESVMKILKQSFINLFKMNWVTLKRPSTQQIEELEDILCENNPNGFFQFPSFEITKTTVANLMNLGNPNSLQGLITKSRNFPFSQYYYNRKVHLIHYGSDRQLSKFINEIANSLINISPGDYQRIVFYLLPIRNSPCSLCSYLAYKDLWYKRFVYDALAEKSLFPLPQVDEEIKDTFPAYLYSKTMQMYLREANRKVPFRIFKCQIMFLEPQEEKTVYFFSHILLGASVQVEKARYEQKGNEKFDAMDYYIDKTKVNTTYMTVRSRIKIPGMEETVQTEEKYLGVEDFQLLNAPRQYFFGHQPSPLSDFLELSMLLTHSAKVFRSEIDSKDNFKRHSEGQIKEALRDLFIRETIDSIVIECPDSSRGSLKMLIDEQLLTKVDKIKVEPAFTCHKLPLILPVQCFLPFEE